MNQLERLKARSAAAEAQFLANHPIVLPLVIADYTGVYFINPSKAAKHDSYYNSIENKIPNPTMRTALLGE